MHLGHRIWSPPSPEQVLDQLGADPIPHYPAAAVQATCRSSLPAKALMVPEEVHVSLPRLTDGAPLMMLQRYKMAAEDRSGDEGPTVSLHSQEGDTEAARAVCLIPKLY